MDCLSIGFISREDSLKCKNKLPQTEKKAFTLSQPDWKIHTRDNVFKNGSSKICGRQHLKNFTRAILEYIVSYIILSDGIDTSC